MGRLLQPMRSRNWRGILRHPRHTIPGNIPKSGASAGKSRKRRLRGLLGREPECPRVGRYSRSQPTSRGKRLGQRWIYNRIRRHTDADLLECAVYHDAGPGAFW